MDISYQHRVIDSALKLSQPVYVPSSVSKEILGKKDESASFLEELQIKKRLVVLEAGNRLFINALGNRLGRGEAEAIAIALLCSL